MSTITTISGTLFASMVSSGAGNLNNNRQIVNDLNVFPIPDGDTGDNMFMTIHSGVSSVKDSNLALEQIAALISKGMLFGARGNSGVILSRIFAGISKGLEGIIEADLPQLKNAFQLGVQHAYLSVKKPVEGTILTVFKDAVTKAQKADTIEEFFDILLKESKESLDRTPSLLQVLKDAGVVDSGGAGLLYIIEGMYKCLLGYAVVPDNNSQPVAAASTLDFSLFNENSVLEFGYCTEFLLQLTNSKVDVPHFDETIILNYLTSVGESVVCFREGSIIKVHVHTFTPGVILNEMQKYGEFLTIKIENMTLQHNEVVQKETTSSFTFQSEKKSKYATVAVASGDGIKELFLSSGIDYVVEGGQHSNPSTEDFIEAFKKVDAENIFVFPNNGNIIMAANQAASLYTDAQIIVIPTHNIGECYASVSMMDLSIEDPHELEALLLDYSKQAVTGQVSIASRTTTLNGIDIQKDSYIGFVDGTILVCSKTPYEAAQELASKLNIQKHDIALIIYGQDTKVEDAELLLKELESTYKRTEFALIEGKQPLFDYIFILE